MKIKLIILFLCAVYSLPVSAQIFGYSMRNSSQQLIDEALTGAFVKITQGYELCDTVTNDHFGRNGEAYFSMIPFIGVKTERGLLVPAEIGQPWTCDKDFDEYKGQYKPLLTESIISELNVGTKTTVKSSSPFIGDKIADGAVLVSDSTYFSQGMQVDTLAGQKKGWFIWVSSANFEKVDSVQFTSLSEAIDVPVDGKPITVDMPNFTETVYGGIYVTPVQSAIGQVSLLLTGYMVSDDSGWQLTFPFIKTNREVKPLTPIANSDEFEKSDPTNNRRR